MGAVESTTLIDAPPARVWAVLADIGSISRWNPGVKHSEATGETPSGEGATRRCELPGGRFLSERAHDWVEGHSYKIEIVDSNLPLRRSTVGFAIAPEGEGTRVTVRPEYELKGGALGRVMDRLIVRRAYRKGFGDLLAGLKHHVETGEEIGSRVPKR